MRPLKGQGANHAELIQTEKGGLTAVRLKFESELPLDKFSGIELLLEPCRADGFTAIYRHSEFWCRPAFCQSAQQIPPDTQCLFVAGRLPAARVRRQISVHGIGNAGRIYKADAEHLLLRHQGVRHDGIRFG